MYDKVPVPGAPPSAPASPSSPTAPAPTKQSNKVDTLQAANARLQKDVDGINSRIAKREVYLKQADARFNRVENDFRTKISDRAQALRMAGKGDHIKVNSKGQLENVRIKDLPPAERKTIQAERDKAIKQLEKDIKNINKFKDKLITKKNDLQKTIDKNNKKIAKISPKPSPGTGGGKKKK